MRTTAMMRKPEEIFRIKPDVPADLRPALKRTLWPLACMVPGWCHHVNVYYHAKGDDDCNASCNSQHDYRWLTIYVHPGWLEGDDGSRAEDMAHELAHAIIGPLADWSRDVLKRLCKKEDAEKFHSVLMESQRERVEMVVQDVTHLFLQSRDDGKRNRPTPVRRPRR